MGKKITIKINKEGIVDCLVHGFKGRACLDNLELLEELVEGKISKHEMTEEYYQTQETIDQKNDETLTNDIKQ